MNAGGSGKDAYELLQDLMKGGCAKCDTTKADCENSMFPDNQGDCWAADAYQKCGDNSQIAYDAVMKAGGSTE